jgi:hypothetical protein
MILRTTVIAVSAVVALAGGVSAEPAKPVSHEASQPPTHPVAPAPADAPKAPLAIATSAQASSKPVRVARVTTCRCGDPAVQRDEGEQ